MWMTVADLRKELAHWDDRAMVVINTPDRLFERYALKRIETGFVDVQDETFGGEGSHRVRRASLVLHGDELVGGKNE